MECLTSRWGDLDRLISESVCVCVWNICFSEQCVFSDLNHTEAAGFIIKIPSEGGPQACTDNIGQECWLDPWFFPTANSMHTHVIVFIFSPLPPKKTQNPRNPKQDSLSTP